MKKFIPCTAVLICGMAAAQPACRIVDARYTYSAGTGRADFIALPKLKGFVSPLAMHVNLEGKRDLWFLFDQGSARYVSLISITDPTAKGWTPPDPDGGPRPIPDQKFFAWSDDLKIVGNAPRPDSPAPGFVLIPDLPETLQYASSNRMVIGSGMFKLHHCAR